MGINSMLVTSAVIVIFVFAIINFSLGFAIDNNAEVDLTDSDFIDGLNTTIKTNADEGFITTNATLGSFEKANIAEDSESGTLPAGSVFKEPPKSNIRTVYTFIRKGQAAIFGEDAGFNTIFTVIVSLVGAVLAWAVYKAWKGGNPD